jgi:hypothetical protein
MRRLTIVLAAAALALPGCNKKKDDAGKNPPASGSTAAGTGTGSMAGSGAMAGTGAGSMAGSAGAGSMAGSGAGSEVATGDPGAGGTGTLTNKLGNCPSAVVGATTAIVDDPAAAGKLVLHITAKDADATSTIRRRLTHLVEVQAAPDAEIKHTGDGTGGGAGLCPVITTKDVTVTAADIEGGSKVTLEPQAGADLAALRKEVEDRIAKTAGWAEGHLTGTPHSGGGGGNGGGKGDHGGNHSGDGDGRGKQKPPTKI